MPRPPSRPEPDDVEWAFDGEGSAARWAVGDADDTAAARRSFTPGERPVGSPVDSPVDEADDHEDADGRHRDPRLRRLANRAAAAALIGLVVLGLVRAYRGDQTHRLILRDVQHVVRLEADAMADGDRALYMSLQDDQRRRALRRPDRAAEERLAVGPLPGLHFTGDPPVVADIEIAATDAARNVEAVTATIRMAATDGVQVGRFEQERRMVRAADGRWRHALSPGSDSGHAVARFVASRIHAAFAASDEPLLRPLLATANNALEQYCTEQDRCAGRARLAFGQADAQAVDVALRLTAPNAAIGWFPADPPARALTTFGIARAAALRLDSAFNTVVRPDGVAFTYGQQSGIGNDMTVATALVDIGLAAHLDPDIVDAWADDTTAADAGLTLWHLGARRQPGRSFEPMRWVMDELPPRDVAVAARSFAAATHRASPERLKRLAGLWPAEIAARRESLWLSPMSIQRDFGRDGLAELLDWPTPHQPFVADGAVTVTCRGAHYVLAADAGIADLDPLACDGGRVARAAWSPDGEALAVACVPSPDPDDPPVPGVPPTLALVRRDAARGGWFAARTLLPVQSADPIRPTALRWAPDGRRIAWTVYIEALSVFGGVERAGVIEVDATAAEPWRDDAGPSDGVLPIDASFGGPPEWAPDAATVALARRDQRIALQPMDGGGAEYVDGEMLAWSPDGTRVARILRLPRSDAAASAEGSDAETVGETDDASGDESDDAADAATDDEEDPAAAATGDTGNVAFALSVVDARTLVDIARVRLDTAVDGGTGAGSMSPPAPGAMSTPLGISWSDDGEWVGAAFRTGDRCGDRPGCHVAFAWQPGVGRLRSVADEWRRSVDPWSSLWQTTWLPDSHRLALHVAGMWVNEESAVIGDEAAFVQTGTDTREVDGAADPEIAYVLDADDGQVEAVQRSQSASLASILPDYSPDGRWHARRDRMLRLIVEPTSGIGGYAAGDGATGWRFNRPFCSPYLEWSGGRSTE